MDAKQGSPHGDGIAVTVKCGTSWVTSRRAKSCHLKWRLRISRTSSSRKFYNDNMVTAFETRWLETTHRIVKIPWGCSVLSANQLTCAFACHCPGPFTIFPAMRGWLHAHFKGALALQRVIEETPRRAEGTAGRTPGQASDQVHDSPTSSRDKRWNASVNTIHQSKNTSKEVRRRWGHAILNTEVVGFLEIQYAGSLLPNLGQGLLVDQTRTIWRRHVTTLCRRYKDQKTTQKHALNPISKAPLVGPRFWCSGLFSGSQSIHRKRRPAFVPIAAHFKFCGETYKRLAVPTSWLSFLDVGKQP